MASCHHRSISRHRICINRHCPGIMHRSPHSHHSARGHLWPQLRHNTGHQALTPTDSPLRVLTAYSPLPTSSPFPTSPLGEEPGTAGNSRISGENRIIRKDRKDRKKPERPEKPDYPDYPELPKTPDNPPSPPHRIPTNRLPPPKVPTDKMAPSNTLIISALQ